MPADTTNGRIVRAPSDEQISVAFKEYSLAVGNVAYSWNYFQEKLAGIFVVVTGMEKIVACAIWYSIESDRAQRQMLRAAVNAHPPGNWLKVPSATKDIKWLLDEADKLSDSRNNAVHAPASLFVGAPIDGPPVMGPAFWSGHPRAKKLKSKNMLDEFARCAASTELLAAYASQLETAIAFPEQYPWPSKPTNTVQGRVQVPKKGTT